MTTMRSPWPTTPISVCRRRCSPRACKRAFRFVDELRAGSIVVNDSTDFWEPHPPFGGASRTRTGWGRIGGKYTLLDMTDLRTAVIDIRTNT